MSKELKQVVLQFDCKPDALGVWQTIASADIIISASEYPDMPPKRKGIVIVLTPAQQATILSFIRNSVIAQAEGAK